MRLPCFCASPPTRRSASHSLFFDEAVADSCAGRKRGQVTRRHAVEVSVDPRVNLTFDYVDELFLLLFRVWPRRARAGRKTPQVDPDANKTGTLSQTAIRPHLLRALRIDVCTFREVAC